MDRKLRSALIKAAIELDPEHYLPPDKLTAKLIEQGDAWEKLERPIARQTAEGMFRSWLAGFERREENDYLLPFIASIPFKEADKIPKALHVVVDGKTQRLPIYRANFEHLDQEIEELDAEIDGKTAGAKEKKARRARLKQLRRTALPSASGDKTMLIADALAVRQRKVEITKLAVDRQKKKLRRVRIRSAKGAHA